MQVFIAFRMICHSDLLSTFRKTRKSTNFIMNKGIPILPCTHGHVHWKQKSAQTLRSTMLSIWKNLTAFFWRRIKLLEIIKLFQPRKKALKNSWNAMQVKQKCNTNGISFWVLSIGKLQLEKIWFELHIWNYMMNYADKSGL